MRVGYIGLGNMGRPMASHIAPAGFELSVYDVVPESVAALTETGAHAAGSAVEVAQAAEVLCLCVPADLQIRQILLGEGGGEPAIEHLAQGAVVAIHSTVMPETVQAVAAAGAERGVEVIDAAVTGGAAGAAAGQLVFLVGGADAAVERARPVLDASSKLVIHAGPLGCGAKLKLAVNALGYIHFAAVNEAFGLAIASGIDPKHLQEALRGNGNLTGMEEQFLNTTTLPEEVVASEDYQRAMGVQLFNAEKDLAHALELARKHGFTMPTAALVSQNMDRIYRVRRD